MFGELSIIRIIFNSLGNDHSSEYSFVIISIVDTENTPRSTLLLPACLGSSPVTTNNHLPGMGISMNTTNTTGGFYHQN